MFFTGGNPRKGHHRLYHPSTELVPSPIGQVANLLLMYVVAAAADIVTQTGPGGKATTASDGQPDHERYQGMVSPDGKTLVVDQKLVTKTAAANHSRQENYSKQPMTNPTSPSGINGEDVKQKADTRRYYSTKTSP